MRDSVLDGLNVTSHLDAQACTLARSELSFSAASMGFSTMRYRLVSSAKSLIQALMLNACFYDLNLGLSGVGPFCIPRPPFEQI